MSEERRPVGGPGAGRPAAPPPGMPFGRGAMGMPVQKAKDFKGTLKRFLSYFAPLKFQLGIVVGAAILSTIFSIVSPKILGMATTKLFEGIVAKYQGIPGAGVDFGYIGGILEILAVLYVISALFSYVQQYVMAGVAQKMVYALRNQVEEKLSRLPLKFFDSRTHGEILSRAVNDMDNISSTLQQSLTQLITSAVTVLGVIVMMLSISLILTLVLLITLPLSIFVTTFIAKRSQVYFKTQQKSLGQLNGHVEEMYTGHRIVKAFGQEAESIEKFDVLNEQLYQAGWKAQFISGIIMPLMMFIGNLGYVFVCVIGGLLVTNRGISIGDVQAFIQYTQQFTMPLTQLANISQHYPIDHGFGRAGV